MQVKDVTIPESIQWRLRPIIEEVDPTLIYGFGGGGKSYMAAYMSTLISEAFPTEGFDVEPGDILYLDYESNKVSFARRIHKIHNGLGLEQQSTIHYRRCAQPLTHDIHEVQRIVLERGIQMVVVDTAAPACGGEPETAKNAIQFFSALRSLSIPALVLAHKSKVTGAQGPFGSAFWWNNPRNVFLVKSEPSSDPDIVHLGIFHEKANEGRLQPPIGLRLEFTSSDAVHIHREDVRDVPEMADNVEIKDRIAIVLKRHGAMTRDEIVDELQEKPDSVSKALSRNKDTLFIRLSANRWGLHTRGWDS